MSFSKNTLRPVNSGAYTFSVAETTVTGFGDLIMLADEPPILAVFFRPLRLRTSIHGGPCGAAFGLAGANVPVRQPCMCPPPSFGDERRAPLLTLEASMPKALARPEQSHFPLAVSAGRHAADLWLQSPQMSLCDWRDSRFAAHACGMGFTDLAERRAAFNDAFAQGIANAIAKVLIVAVEVSHA